MLPPNLLNENCDDLTLWTNGDAINGVSSVNPAGQFQFAGNTHAATNTADRHKVIISPPDKFTIETRIYFDALGTITDNDFFNFYYSATSWRFALRFASDGLFVRHAAGATTEVGTDIVLCNAGAAWQTWRFQVDKSAGVANAVVEVFLNSVSQGSLDCSYQTGIEDGRVTFQQLGYTTDNMLSHVDYIRIATGLGEISSATAKILIAGF
jgi:hypothetical protein